MSGLSTTTTATTSANMRKKAPSNDLNCTKVQLTVKLIITIIIGLFSPKYSMLTYSPFQAGNEPDLKDFQKKKIMLVTTP